MNVISHYMTASNNMPWKKKSTVNR